MMARQIERIRRCRRLDHLVVATSREPADDAIAALSQSLQVDCFRGALDDVLDRVYQAARPYGAPHVVRLTADCPLADPEVIDATVECFLAGGYDYATNALDRTFPIGLDVEAFRFRCLEDAHREARTPDEREHVTPFMYGQPQRYRVGQYRHGADLSDLRWTVDDAGDYAFVSAVYAELYSRNPAFGWRDVLSLLDARPDLRRVDGRQATGGAA